MKRMICLLMTLVCLCTAALAEEIPSFTEYSCRAVDCVNDVIVDVFGGDAVYTDCSELAAGEDCCTIFYSADGNLTAMLQPGKELQSIGSGSIWTNNRDHVTDAIFTLLVLNMIDGTTDEDAMEAQEWLNGLQPDILALFDNPSPNRDMENCDAIRESFAGAQGRLSIVLDATPTDSGVMFNLTFNRRAADQVR